MEKFLQHLNELKFMDIIKDKIDDFKFHVSPLRKEARRRERERRDRVKKYNQMVGITDEWNKQYINEKGIKQALSGDNPQDLRNQITKTILRIQDKMKKIKSGRDVFKNIKRIEQGHAPNVRRLTTALSKHPGKHGDEARTIVNDPRIKAEKIELFKQKQARRGGVERN